MPVQGLGGNRKKKVKGTLDYDRLCAAFCREWPYITPDYFYHEMDIWDLNKLAPMMDPKLYASCWISRGNGGGLDEAVADGVIRRKK